MHDESSSPDSRFCSTIKAFAKWQWLLLAAALCALPTGCASTSDRMSASAPDDRRGAPPYADDAEANGNPAKAWYN